MKRHLYQINNRKKLNLIWFLIFNAENVWKKSEGVLTLQVELVAGHRDRLKWCPPIEDCVYDCVCVCVCVWLYVWGGEGKRESEWKRTKKEKENKGEKKLKK